MLAGRPEFSEALRTWRVGELLEFMFAMYVRSEKDKLRAATARAVKRAMRRMG